MNSLTDREAQILILASRKNGVKIKNDRGWKAYIADDLRAEKMLTRSGLVDDSFIYRITEPGTAALKTSGRMPAPKPAPMRWRKAKNPDAGGRWDTPMNRMIWNRDHGNDVELWQGDVRLAVVAPTGSWSATVGTHRHRVHQSADVETAKSEAKAWVLSNRGHDRS